MGIEEEIRRQLAEIRTKETERDLLLRERKEMIIQKHDAAKKAAQKYCEHNGIRSIVEEGMETVARINSLRASLEVSEYSNLDSLLDLESNKLAYMIDFKVTYRRPEERYRIYYARTNGVNVWSWIDGSVVLAAGGDFLHNSSELFNDRREIEKRIASSLLVVVWHREEYINGVKREGSIIIDWDLPWK